MDATKSRRPTRSGVCLGSALQRRPPSQKSSGSGVCASSTRLPTTRGTHNNTSRPQTANWPATKGLRGRPVQPANGCKAVPHEKGCWYRARRHHHRGKKARRWPPGLMQSQTCVVAGARCHRARHEERSARRTHLQAAAARGAHPLQATPPRPAAAAASLLLRRARGARVGSSGGAALGAPRRLAAGGRRVCRGGSGSRPGGAA